MIDRRGNEMPTSLPERARRGIDVFLVFVIALAACTVLIEIVDPAPMDVAAEMLTAL